MAVLVESGQDSERMKITRPKSLTELVVDELRARIIDGRLRLGEALSENALAADLGISKTPVREALLQLKLERLVDVLPQRGTYVFRLARDQVVMISELREILELPAAAAAIERNHAALVARMTEIFEEMRKAYRGRRQRRLSRARRRISSGHHRSVRQSLHQRRLQPGRLPHPGAALAAVGRSRASTGSRSRITARC